MIQRHDILNNSEAFQNYIENLDEELRRDLIPIPSRPISAFSRIAKTGMPMIIGGVVKDECADVIHEWFQKRYGAKLNIDFTVGRSIVLIRDDPYVMRVPRVYGKWDGIVNVEHVFEGFTQNYFASLKESELNNIVTLFANHKESFEYIEQLSPDVKAALNASTNYIIDEPHHYGQSKWHAQLAVELSLKFYINSLGGIIPTDSKGHDIKKLAKEAVRLGFSQIPAKMLNEIRCLADERYMKDKNWREVSVTLRQAVTAQHNAIQLCGEIARIMNLPEYIKLVCSVRDSRKVLSFFVAGDHKGRMLNIKILMAKSHDAEVFHIQTSNARWLADRIQEAMDANYLQDGRKSKNGSEESLKQINLIEHNYPKLTDDDWHNRQGEKWATGLNLQLFEDLGGLIISLHSEEQKVYIFSNQALIYLKEWINDYLSEPVFQNKLASTPTNARL